MPATLRIGEIIIDVVRKEVKNLHLSVKPPDALITITAPLHTSDHAIRAFAVGKLRWIRQQQAKLRSQPRETPREYLDRESHYVWGRRCLLTIIKHDAAAQVDLAPNRLIVSVRSNARAEQLGDVIERWYRDQLRDAVAPMIAHWQPKIGVEVQRLHIQKMKTRWGSCNSQLGSIRLNTDLAKKPPECLEYILVHELVHLVEPTHNARFAALMDRFLPNWPLRRDQLNQLPLRHSDWDY